MPRRRRTHPEAPVIDDAAVYTREKVVELLRPFGVSLNSIREAVQAGQLRVERGPKGKYTVLGSSLRQWIEAREKKHSKK